MAPNVRTGGSRHTGQGLRRPGIITEDGKAAENAAAENAAAEESREAEGAVKEAAEAEDAKKPADNAAGPSYTPMTDEQIKKVRLILWPILFVIAILVYFLTRSCKG